MQRIPVLLNLLSATRANHQCDGDVSRCGKLQGGGPKIVSGRDTAELLALFDRRGRNLEVLLAVVVAPASGDESGIKR